MFCGKNPVCITLHLVEFHLLQYNDGFKTREVDRTIEDIQDRTSLIKIGPSSHQHVTIAEKMVTWFLAAYESGGWCKNKIGFIIKPLSLSAVNEDTPPEFQERRLRQVPVSEASGLSKSVMDILLPFIHNGPMSLSRDMSDSIPVKKEMTLQETK